MRIATHNINGIRAAQRRGFTDWLAGRDLDVVALQEVRCPVAALPLDAFGDHHVVYEPGTLAGRNGVAILTRTPVAEVRSWGAETFAFAPGQEPVMLDPGATEASEYVLARELRTFAHEGRYIEVDLADEPLTVASLYLPKGGLPEHLNTTPGRNGQIDPQNPARYARKMAFMAGFARHLDRTRLAAAKAGREFLVMGDFNIAHTNADLKNWRSNQKSEGFLPEERAWLGSLLGPRKLTDVVRALRPDEDGPYSWWSWMGQSFNKDVGWRIDYHLATRKLAKKAVSAVVDREADYEARMSDHAPVVVDYDLG